MLQAKLKDAGWRFQLCAEAIADPNLGARFDHQLLDDLRVPSRGNQVVDGRSADENPVPEVTPADPGAGLIALDHGACDDLLFDLRRSDGGPFTGASDDRGDPAFAQFEAAQFAQRLDDPLVTQMLLMVQENHRRLQTRPEITVGFQPPRQLAAIEASTMRAD